MARKDAIEVEGTVVEFLPNTMFCVELAKWPSRTSAYFRENASEFHSYLARRESYARGFPLRFVEGRTPYRQGATAERTPRFLSRPNYESATISKETL